MTAVALAGGRSGLRPTADVSGPAQVGDVVSAVVTNAVGLGLLLTGAVGGRHTVDPDRLLLFVTTAAVGLVVALAGNAAFVLTCLRAVTALRHQVLDPPVPAADRTLVATTAAGPTVHGDARVTAPGMTRYHRADCAAVRGKDARPVEDASALLPCGLCTEDER